MVEDEDGDQWLFEAINKIQDPPSFKMGTSKSIKNKSKAQHGYHETKS